jgi:hypothetical protein
MSPQAAQLIPYVLPSKTYAAGGRDVVALRDLPKTYLGRICHLVKFVLDINYTPTFTTAPTTVGNNAFLAACDFWDGTLMRHVGGGGNVLRARERLSLARQRIPDADTNGASGVLRAFRRVLHCGPPHAKGFPTDFVIPTAILDTGELRLQYGALTDLSADTTAATGTLRVTAYLMLLDEVRIPPAYQFMTQAMAAADNNIPGRAAYESLSLMYTSFANFSAGDVGNVSLDLGQGFVIPSVKAQDLQVGYQDAFEVGELGAFMGDLDSGTATVDTGFKKINHGTPTQVVTGDNDLQVMLFNDRDFKISKMQVAESVARVRWDGAKTSATTALLGRILPQQQAIIAQKIAMARQRLGLPGSGGRIDIKTLSKRPYRGPMGEFMPWVAKIA